jgi:hypothetical protein
MSRTCTICKHQSQEAINAALLGPESLRKISSRWSVSKTALLRHKADHLPAAVVKAVKIEEAISGGKLLERLKELNRETSAILHEARTAGTKDNQLALKAISRVEKQLEIESKMLGELNQDATVDLRLTPEWQNLRAAILSALERHPAAHAAVVEAIKSQGGVNHVAA